MGAPKIFFKKNALKEKVSKNAERVKKCKCYQDQSLSGDIIMKMIKWFFCGAYVCNPWISIFGFLIILSVMWWHNNEDDKKWFFFTSLDVWCIYLANHNSYYSNWYFFSFLLIFFLFKLIFSLVSYKSEYLLKKKKLNMPIA